MQPFRLDFDLNVVYVRKAGDAPLWPNSWDQLWLARMTIISRQSLPDHSHPSHPHQGNHPTYLNYCENPQAPWVNVGCRLMYGRPATAPLNLSNAATFSDSLSLGAFAGVRESREVLISELAGRLRLLHDPSPLLAALIEANNDELLELFRGEHGG